MKLKWISPSIIIGFLIACNLLLGSAQIKGLVLGNYHV